MENNLVSVCYAISTGFCSFYKMCNRKQLFEGTTLNEVNEHTFIKGWQCDLEITGGNRVRTLGSDTMCHLYASVSPSL